MPCRDYEDDNRWVEPQLREQNSKLARIACNALAAFTEADPRAASKFLDDNDEADQWWSEHQKADDAAKAERERKAAEHKLKNSALAKLTPEERKVLGV
jgi:hypothetical protein